MLTNYRQNTNKDKMLLKFKQTTRFLLLAKLFACGMVMLCFNQAIAQSSNHISGTVSSTTNNNSIQNVPNSSVTLDFSINTAESWDTQNDTSNVVAHCINGMAITGFEYSNITMQSIPGSFFSETVFYFSDSNQGIDSGIKFKMGAGNDTSGTAVFNSNGIFDITDAGIPEDIYSLSDGKFILQIFEDIDDKPNSIDSSITNGTMTIWGVDLVAVEGCPFVNNTMPPLADLSVSYTTDQSGSEIGDTVDVTFVVSNIGDSLASNVVIQNTLSDNLDLIELSCNDGSNTTERNNLTNFSVQNIAVQSNLECLLKTEINDIGNLAINISSSADSEINLNNNSVDVIFGPALATVPINNLLALIILCLLIFVPIRKYIKQ